MPKYTKHQLLLIRIRDTLCDGTAAKLARKIGKADSYVHRLFYPIPKKGGKGIGLELMGACNAAFSLPIGYWDSELTADEEKQVADFLVAFPPSGSTKKESRVQHLSQWPFKLVFRSQWELLSDEQKSHVENGIMLLVKARADPEKNERPAYSSAATNAA